MSQVSAFINFLGLRGYWIFFLMMWYLGTPYTGIEDSNYYIIFWVIISILTAIQIATYFINKTVPKSIPVAIVIVITIVLFFYSVDMIGHSFFNIFIGMCIPCIFLGINCAINKNEERCMKFLGYLLILSLIPFLFVFRDMLQEIGGPRLSFETGSGPLGIGYNAAIFFVFLTMASIVKEKGKNNYNLVWLIIRNRYFKLFVMLFLVLVVLASGSRGPLVAILVAPLLLMFIYRGKISIKTFRAIILILFLLTGLVYLVAYNPFPGFDVPISRITNLVEGLTTGDALETAASGRDIIFLRAVELFKENPILGEGFLGYIIKYGTYPHNLLLELLTDFGIVGAFIILSCIIYLFAGIVKRIKLNISTIPFYSILAVEVVKLMFSATYINSQVLFFFIGFAISCRLDTPYPDRLKKDNQEIGPSF